MRGVEAGVVDHGEDGADAVAGGAEGLGEGAVVLDLGRGVGAVAELVLEAHQVDGVALAVGGPARDEEAGEALGGLREGEEGVGHRRRAEPLVAGEAPAVGGAVGAGGVGADVGAALLLGHRHADGGAGLVRRRTARRVVGAGEEAGGATGRGRRGTAA